MRLLWSEVVAVAGVILVASLSDAEPRAVTATAVVLCFFFVRMAERIYGVKP